MSHWVTKKQHVLRDFDKDILMEALGELGLGLDYSITEVSNTWGRELCEAAITNSGNPLSLGIKTENGELILVGDFYGLGLSQEQFLDQLAVEYQKINLTEKINHTAWNIDSLEKTENNGYELNISMVA